MPGRSAHSGDVERFWSMVEPTGFCWNWIGPEKPNGYGVFYADNARTPAHRWSYLALVGDYDRSLDLDHLCRNRRCVNPDHLEPVTRAENLRRGFGHGSETHCPSGHQYDAHNTYRYGTTRVCKTCKRARSRERYWATKEAA